MIKAVLFDAGGVLHVKNTAVGDDFQQEFGLSHEQVMEIFRHYVPLIGTGRMTEQQCLDDMAEKWHLRRATESERLFSHGFETTLEKTPGIYDLIDGLKKQGITVAVFSNVTPQFAEVQAQAGHYDPFDYRILSYEAGMWKPDPAFYEYALQTVGARPQETVLVDDQPENIIGARAFGMPAIQFESTNQLRSELAKLL